MKRTVIIEIISLLLVILFLYTGISKMLDYPLFKGVIGTSPILKPVAPFIAMTLPTFECIVAVLLFIPKTRWIGLYLAFMMMIIFTAYIIAILSYGEHIPCSCGGVLEEMSWQTHLVFNVIFTCLSAWAIYLNRKEHRQLSSTIIQ
ncbi:MauE/DoxX family redox-associated membrane protein [Chitinophaga solisilvae]|uniref:MauE/DoxX family redox-associated membrane protein n=1 Tax=Chitinophaga solisilvae TaxID=1233460 RepID=UPI00136DF521|nr:MauE/DoxX family redox-associated membrane protein [Chitinophaga solisilvae]